MWFWKWDTYKMLFICDIIQKIINEFEFFDMFCSRLMHPVLQKLANWLSKFGFFVRHTVKKCNFLKNFKMSQNFQKWVPELFCVRFGSKWCAALSSTVPSERPFGHIFCFNANVVLKMRYNPSTVNLVTAGSTRRAPKKQHTKMFIFRL